MSFLDFIGKLSTTLSFSITFGTVILYGALGEVLTEKGGNLNLGVPGIMYIGAIASLAGALKFEAAFASPNAILCVLVALLCGFAASALAGLLYAFLTISLRTNQNVTGLTLTIFGTGIGNYIGGSLGSVGTVFFGFELGQQLLHPLAVSGGCGELFRAAGAGDQVQVLAGDGRQ